MSLLGGGVLSGVASVLDVVLELCFWLILIRVLISWVNPDPWNPIVQFLTKTTDPILIPIRRRIGLLGGFDVSPIVVFLIIVFLQRGIVPRIHEFAMTMH